LSWWLIAVLAWLAPGVLVSLALLCTAWLQPALRGMLARRARPSGPAESAPPVADPPAELPQPEGAFIAVPALAGMARESDPAADLQCLPNLAGRCSPGVALEA